MLKTKELWSKLSEYLWYAILVEFQLFGTLWAMINVSGKPYLLLYWGFVALALVKLCIQGNSWKEWILIIAFGIVAVLSSWSSQDKTPLLLMLGVCCSKEMNLEKFLKVDIIGRVVSAIITLFTIETYFGVILAGRLQMEWDFRLLLWQWNGCICDIDDFAGMIIQVS